MEVSGSWEKRLVAYFSASGVTKGLAEKLAEAIETDIFEIAPVEPYTEADLKWTNPLARCNREKAGKKRCGNKRNGTGYGQLRDFVYRFSNLVLGCTKYHQYVCKAV